MWTKRLFVTVPFLLSFFLLQSFFWIPDFDDPIRGGTKRKSQFIKASIGDASILNPTLSADASSSDINSQVFEGLLDYDKDIRLRPRLAESWRIYEEATFFVDRNGPETVLKKIEIASGTPSHPHWMDNIEEVKIVSPEILTMEIPDPREENKGEKISATLHLPARIKLTLKEVDQDIFDRMETLLGEGFFQTFKPEDYLEISDATLKSTLAPELIKIKEHKPIILFNIRKGVRFHDGEEFTADDLKFTFDSIMDGLNLSPRRSDFEPVEKLEILDSYSVKITYKRLYSPAVSTWMIGMLPEHRLNRDALKNEAQRLGEDPEKFTMRDSEFNRNPIGTGPFKFESWESDEKIKLIRNEDYWESPPNYSEYIYRIIPNSLGQEMSFYGGTVDLYSAKPHQVERLKKKSRYQNFSGLSFGYTYIGYNMRREPFTDKRVRRALGMAINTQDIIKYLFYGQAETITGPFVKQTDYYNRELQPLPYDPEGALKLLAEAGWKKENGKLVKDGKPMRFSLITNHGNDLRKAILTIVQNSWKKLGVEISGDTVEWAVFLKKYVNVANFDTVILGWSMGIDPDLYQIWHSSQSGPYQLNFVGYENSEADDLIVKIRQEYNREKQIDYTHRLHEVIYEDQPYTFLYVGRWTALLDRKIVIMEKGENKKAPEYKKITATRTGDYNYYFNQWIKLSSIPQFNP